MTAIQITPDQLRRLGAAQSELADLLKEILSGVPEPAWLRDAKRQWALLNDVAVAGGEVGLDEWRALGRKHGYDPRGLGGFFNGAQATMQANGDRRGLSDYGKRWVALHAPDYGPNGK